MNGRPRHGLRPEWAHEEGANRARVREIMGAIERYVQGKQSVPAAWFEELRRRAGTYAEGGLADNLADYLADPNNFGPDQ